MTSVVLPLFLRVCIRARKRQNKIASPDSGEKSLELSHHESSPQLFQRILAYAIKNEDNYYETQAINTSTGRPGFEAVGSEAVCGWGESDTVSPRVEEIKSAISTEKVETIKSEANNTYRPEVEEIKYEAVRTGRDEAIESEAVGTERSEAIETVCTRRDEAIESEAFSTVRPGLVTADEAIESAAKPGVESEAVNIEREEAIESGAISTGKVEVIESGSTERVESKVISVGKTEALMGDEQYYLASSAAAGIP